MNHRSFGSDFVFGVSSSAPQSEFPSLDHGKGASIWDSWLQKKQKRLRSWQACSPRFDQFWRQDIALMKECGFRHFRYSFSWSRLLPEGRLNNINQKGVSFYHELIDSMLEHGIQPWFTLYHWDLPEALQQKGGWKTREILNWFEDYISFCLKEYGDKLKHWMVLNEPQIFIGAGYFLAEHPPSIYGLDNYLPASHHANLVNAAGIRHIQSECRESYVGTTFSINPVEPYTDHAADVSAAKRLDGALHAWYLEPLCLGRYPTQKLPFLNRIEQYVQSDDEKKLICRPDFIGVQNYTSIIARRNKWVPGIQTSVVKPAKLNRPQSMMGWEINPCSPLMALQRVKHDFPDTDLIITENGLPLKDEIVASHISDAQRITYLKQVMNDLKHHIDTIRLKGYFHWTWVDNPEWTEGCGPKFGMLHRRQGEAQCLKKTSFYWWKDFLS